MRMELIKKPGQKASPKVSVQRRKTGAIAIGSIDVKRSASNFRENGFDRGSSGLGSVSYQNK